MADELVAKGVVTKVTDPMSAGQVYVSLDTAQEDFGVWPNRKTKDDSEIRAFRAAMGQEVTFQYVTRVVTKGGEEKTYYNPVPETLKVLGDMPAVAAATRSPSERELWTTIRAAGLMSRELVSKYDYTLAQALAAWDFAFPFVLRRLLGPLAQVEAKGEIDEKTLSHVTAEDIEAVLAERISKGVAASDDGEEWTDEQPE